jgi:hypothetical protein
MKGADWILVWAWVAFLLLIGPLLFSARDSLMVFVGFSIFVALAYLTQRRVVPIIKEKIK